ncbi:GNAT family N-acetyltransferase [Ruegeria lacuscaerulensis]|uniref:GNAT family N-acetyltransferase n=1 Tax=Ruegeria lacuscaerulensis TaxID=55218 RepID=UPI001480F904|nr:GNAT family N-acetyltransferase [Ruegeria lacuscaerulensis]
MLDYSIRPLTATEVQKVVDWAGQEGWNPGVHDAACFHATDPGGFLGGFLGDEMIASVSTVNYDDRFSFLGFYIVHPEFRRAGRGIEIWRSALAYGQGRNIGLDGVIEQQENYAKSGFTLAYTNCRFSAKVQDILPKLGQVLGNGVTELSDAANALRLYDRKLFPAPRDAFLQSWLSAPSHISRMYSENGQIKGYATLRPCLTGYKVGPLFADDVKIAQALLASLLAAVPEHHRDQQVFIDMPQPNAAAFALAAQLGLEKVFETARMYSDHEPDIDLNRVFGVTTFELG